MAMRVDIAKKERKEIKSLAWSISDGKKVQHKGEKYEGSDDMRQFKKIKKKTTLYSKGATNRVDSNIIIVGLTQSPERDRNEFNTN